MKWPSTSIILLFGCLSLASAVPLVLDDTAMMYPAYPYVQNKVNFDFGSIFRKAASSVKHFYSYVNGRIFGKSLTEPHANDTSQHAAINPDRVHIEAYKVYKDSNGHVVVKNIPNIANLPLFSQNALGKFPLSQNSFNKIGSMNIPGLIGPIILDENFNAVMGQSNKVVKKDNPEAKFNLKSLVMDNPFRWNEKLANDQLLGKAGEGMIKVHPVLVRIEGEMLPGAVGNPLNELFNDKQLQEMIAHQIQQQPNPQPQSNAAPNQPQANEPRPQETAPPKITEAPNAPNQPAAESGNKPQAKEEAAKETPVPEGKQNNNDQEDDDEESDESNEPNNNGQPETTAAPKNEPSNQQNQQANNVENQANTNAGNNQTPDANNNAKNNADAAAQRPSGQENKPGFIRVGDKDVSLDTAQKVLKMVQAKSNGNNPNDLFANFKW